MPTETDCRDIRKSMAYDLRLLIEKEPEKTFTVKELYSRMKRFAVFTHPARQTDGGQGKVRQR